MKNIVMASLLAGALVSTAQAENLVVNGSFETGLSGWSYTFDPTLAVTKGYGATDGTMALEFANGNTNYTSLRQSIDTIIGSTYNVAFDWKSSHPTSSGAQSLSFSAIGAVASVLTLLTVSGSYPGAFNASSPFQRFSTTFVANSLKTEIVFQDTSASSDRADQLLDNISITAAVPEPETYAMLMAGLGLLGAVARRRKNKQA